MSIDKCSRRKKKKNKAEIIQINSLCSGLKLPIFFPPWLASTATFSIFGNITFSTHDIPTFKDLMYATSFARADF